MSYVAAPKGTAQLPELATWLPLVGIPVGIVLRGTDWQPWVLMWALAFSVYAGLKWLTFVNDATARSSTVGRSLAYLVAWPGMDAKSFFASAARVPVPLGKEWLLAGAKTVVGGTLIVAAVAVVDRRPLVAGWMGMTGIVFMLHFGVFHLLSLVWRQAGIDAPPIMNRPLLASSLSEFWGRRWNLAFRDLSHRYIFRRFVGKLGISGATMAVFLASGFVHDAVISIPAKGGWGLPTLYFAIQGAGVLAERSQFGKRFGLGNGVPGRLFSITVLLAPIGLLFHQSFVMGVIVPMLSAVAHLRGGL